jgi:hypothetical protein
VEMMEVASLTEVVAVFEAMVSEAAEEWRG